MKSVFDTLRGSYFISIVFHLFRKDLNLNNFVFVSNSNCTFDFPWTSMIGMSVLGLLYSFFTEDILQKRQYQWIYIRWLGCTKSVKLFMLLLNSWLLNILATKIWQLKPFRLLLRCSKSRLMDKRFWRFYFASDAWADVV